MSHLEGVLTLVNSSGPWFRIQGRHLRSVGAPRVGFQVFTAPDSGITVDFHAGEALWIRAGWYPTHKACALLAHGRRHRCWARWLRPVSYGTV